MTQQITAEYAARAIRLAYQEVHDTEPPEILCQTIEWHVNELVRERQRRIEVLEGAANGLRDSVLHERYHLANAGLDNDQVNAVLANFDYAFSTALSPE